MYESACLQIAYVQLGKLQVGFQNISFQHSRVARTHSQNTVVKVKAMGSPHALELWQGTIKSVLHVRKLCFLTNAALWQSHFIEIVGLPYMVIVKPANIIGMESYHI